MDSTGTVVEAQADWLTVTRALASGDRAMLDLYEQLRVGEPFGGDAPRVFHMQGFTVYRAGRVAYGCSGTRELLQLSGNLAQLHLGGALAVSEHATRFDVAVTVRQDPPNPMFGQEVYRRALSEYARGQRFPLPSITADANGGCTVYLGRRTSENFARIYNKAAERRSAKDWAGERHYGGCWRWELETKGQLAPRLSRAVRDAPDPHHFVQDYLCKWAERHRLEPDFPRTGSQLYVEPFHRRADDDRSVAWLDSQVVPVLRRLYQHGRGEDVRRTLGGLLQADTPG